MEKYIYKCENTICENEFKDSEPQNCPKCGSEDIIIIGEPKKLWLILITVLFIAALGGGYWYYQLGESCNCTHENNIHLECCDDYDGTIKQVKLDTNHHENYIEVLSPGVDKFQITLEDKNFDEVYRDGNKFYPNSSGKYKFHWVDLENEIIAKEYSKSFEFELIGEYAGCKICPFDKDNIFFNPDPENKCTYTLTGLDNLEIEVSLSKDTDYKKHKVKWTQDEINGNEYIYVKHIGCNTPQKINILDCTPKKEPKMNPSVVTEAFNEMLSNPSTTKPLWNATTPKTIFKVGEKEYKRQTFFSLLRQQQLKIHSITKDDVDTTNNIINIPEK